MTRLYDISMPVVSGGIVYPGNPEIRFSSHQAIARGDSANVSQVAFGSHTGTHVDAPRHFDDAGIGVDELPLDRLCGPAVLLHFPDDVMSIGARELRDHDLGGHIRVLLKTRNSVLQTKPAFTRDYTYLAPDGAEHLVSRGVQLVGIDYLSVEQFKSGHHRAHHILLDAGVVIVEGLALVEPNAGSYELICLPLRLAGLDGAPARAILKS